MASSHADAQRRLRLLLTDDDRRFMEAMAAFLEVDGRFEVVGMAADGREGVELARTCNPDVVLMDIDMPIMDGVEASRQIHADRPDLPIVLVSASQFADRVANARAAGATGYVQKGRIADDLVKTIVAVAHQEREADDLLQTSLARVAPDFRVLFESGPALQLVLDADFRIVAVTDEYLAATMTRREDILGRGIFDVFPDNPDDPHATGESNLRSSLERVCSNGVADTMAVQKYDIRRPPAEGGDFEVRYWSPVNSPILGPQKELVYIVHRVEDVTEFVRLEEQGTAQEAEILRRSQELQKLNERLRAANEATYELLSRLSGELRAPFGALTGFGELLLAGDLTEEGRQWATMILKTSTHLVALAEDLDELAQLASGTLSISLENVDVNPVIQAAVEIAGPLADDNAVEIDVRAAEPGDVYVLADAQRLTQVLVNLVANAVKFTPSGGKVSVSVAPAGEDRVDLAITDGHTVPSPEPLGGVLEPFAPARAGGRGVGDTGLGLALSLRLVEAMHGTLEVDSIPGVGTSFAIGLERGEPAAVRNGGTGEPTVVAVREYVSERCLLYIEDRITNVERVQQVLRCRPSVELLSAVRGELGIELAREHRPDLILLDLDLPDIRGEEVLARIRADATTREIPIVVLSAESSRDPVLAAAKAQLTKPIGVRRLLEVLDTFLDDPT